MALFHKSVTKKYIINLDHKKVDKAFESYQKFYGNKLRLVNIMQLKEENYQEGFLREIFVQTLGYKINPDQNYNLTTEYKNQKDARKVDGAIIRNGTAIAVIELKSTKTKNPESIKEQAFGYKNNQPDCKYVITSNVQTLKFYVDNATEYEEFNLFHLDKERFKLFYLLLCKESIINDLPEKLKKETKFHETDISDKLYKDFKQFKDKIFESLVKNNKQYDKLTLFKKSQKLLDRFLFVFFAEDCGLIPPNTITKVVTDWKQLKKLNYYQPLYKLFKEYFSYLNKGKNIEDWGIPAYNGGLFKNDEILDNPELIIEDQALEKDSLKISAYNFNTDVDVNILGHIFEHSLNEIEEITAELQGEKIDKKKSKRKKDGVFYTPKYITKYIVENTVGTICNEKKEKLQITNLLIDDKLRRKDGNLNKKGKQLFEVLKNYKKWLLTLKILDPACGSGAFLNQTLDYLITEHNEIDNIISELTGDNLRLFDTDKSILENNIFGVDINEESVEIAKLSLWLRTAQKGRELSDLSGNIKCGNSLIDDPKVAGDKAFDWNIEFKAIMDNGGFDVVIGNPPYVPVKQQEINTRLYLKNNYKFSSGSDLYVAFIERSFLLLKDKKYFSFICPNKFFGANYGKKIRTYMKNNLNVFEIWDLKDKKVFKDALISIIVISIKKEKKIGNTILLKKKNKIIEITLFDDNNKIQIEQNIEAKKIISKLDNNRFLEEFAEIRTGIMGFEYWKMKEIISNKGIKLFTNGNIQRYNNLWEFSEINLYKEKYQMPHIELNSGFLNSNTINLFSQKNKIIVRGVARKISAIICETAAGLLVAVHSIVPKKEMNEYFVLSIINSKLINWYHQNVFYSIKIPHGSLKYPISFFKKIPVKNIEHEKQQPFIEKADLMLSLNKELQKEKNNFLNTLQEEKDMEKLSKKLQNFQNLEYNEFKKEIEKKKITLKLGTENNERQEYFNTSKQKINELQNKINKTDKEIDQMVYKLYELTEEEITIIENSIKQTTIK